MIQMAVFATTIFIIRIVFTPSWSVIKSIITGVASENIFGTGFNRM